MLNAPKLERGAPDQASLANLAVPAASLGGS
jgi:hypothetical protein